MEVRSPNTRPSKRACLPMLPVQRGGSSQGHAPRRFWSSLSGCSGQGTSRLNVCKKAWLRALNAYPGATSHKGQNILEVNGVAIFLRSSLHLAIQIYLLCELPGPAPQPSGRSQTRFTTVRKGER